MARRVRKKRPSLFLRFYRGLVVVSVLIIVVAVAWRFYIPPPDTAQPDTIDNGQSQDPHQLRKDGFYTFLLVGSDAGDTNADSIMVVGYDTEQGSISVISVPRDTMIYRDWASFPKLNAGMQKGIDQLKAEVSYTLGIPIDFYLHITLDAFVRVVDELGGLDYYVPQDMYHDDQGGFIINLSEGQQHLTGHQTLQLVRYRGYASADIGRTQTQQGVLSALADQLLSLGTLTKVQPFVEIFFQEVSTDLSLSNLLWFAKHTLQVTDLQVTTQTLAGRGDAYVGQYTWCFELDQPNTLSVVNSMLSPFVEDRTLADLMLRTASGYHN